MLTTAAGLTVCVWLVGYTCLHQHPQPASVEWPVHCSVRLHWLLASCCCCCCQHTIHTKLHHSLSFTVFHSLTVYGMVHLSVSQLDS